MPPHPKNQDEISTRTYVVDALSEKMDEQKEEHYRNCPYRRDKDAWFDSKLLKTLGIVYGIASPWFIWVTVSCFNMSGQIDLIKQKQEVIQELNLELKEIRKELSNIKIDLAAIKRNP